MRIAAQLPTLAADLMDASLAEIPSAGGLDADHFVEDFAPVLVAGVARFLCALEERRTLTRAEVIELATPLVEGHAEDRLPQRALLDGLYGGMNHIWNLAIEAAEPDDLPDLFTLSQQLLKLLSDISVAISDVYTEVEQSLYGGDRQARRALCAALLDGDDPESAARRADITVAERYDVLALRLRAVERVAPMSDHTLARRRMRLVQHVLDEASGTTALHTFDGTSGVALLPAGGGHARLAHRLTDLLGTDVLIVAEQSVPTTALPDLARHLTESAELARMLDRPVEVYDLDDLLLEYQLTRPGPVRDRLIARIAPLLDHPHLVEALDVHIRFGTDRKAAAAELYLHPNTLSYRLRRVAEITGIDPVDTHGSRLMAAAFLNHNLFPTAADQSGPSFPE